MFEWLVGTATMALIFLVSTVMMANRYLAMYEEVKKLERYNENLRYSMKTLRAENEKLQSSHDVEKMTALKMSLHLKQEEIEELREKIQKQNVLLKQKWEGSKK